MFSTETSPDYTPSASQPKHKNSAKSSEKSNGVRPLNGKHNSKARRSVNIPSTLESSTSTDDDSDDDVQVVLPKNQPGGHQKHSYGKDGSRVMHSPPGFGQRVAEQVCSPGGSLKRVTRSSRSKVISDLHTLNLQIFWILLVFGMV